MYCMRILTGHSFIIIITTLLIADITFKIVIKTVFNMVHVKKVVFKSFLVFRA